MNIAKKKKKKEIQYLLAKNLTRPSHSPWSCATFYVQKAYEIERGTPKFVINYKALNKVLQWIRYPIPHKKDLNNRLYNATLFSKFNMKSGFWKIQIKEEDKYKIAFTLPLGYYEWSVMPFGLKNAPSKFQNDDVFFNQNWDGNWPNCWAGSLTLDVRLLYKNKKQKGLARIARCLSDA